MHLSNYYYGHQNILSKYCGVASTKKIFGMVAHGVDIGTSFDIRRVFRRLPFLVWNPLLAALYIRQDWSKVVVIGSPLLYVEDVSPNRLSMGNSQRNQEWAGFAPHHIEPGAGRLQLRQFLSDLQKIDCPKGFPIYLHKNEFEDTFCLDLVNDFGFIPATVWKQGDSIFKEDFVMDLIAELRKFDIVIASQPTTAFWYAAYLGIDARVLNATDGQQVERTRSTLLNADYRGHIFWPSTVFDRQKIRESADEELGISFKLAPKDLSRVLGFDSVWKQLLARFVGVAGSLRRFVRYVMRF
jgi:hypothetical protein